MRRSHALVRRSRSFVLCAALAPLVWMAPRVEATSANTLYVCASGCTYTSVQDALDAITTSSVSNPYTVFVDGLVTTDETITFDGKSYITLVGNGMGASIIRASAAFFEQSECAVTAGCAILDLSESTHVTLRGITVDGLTNEPGGLNFIWYANGVTLTSADKIVIDDCEISAYEFGIFNDGNEDPVGLVEIMDSKVVGVHYGIGLWNGVWHIFSSDIRGVGDAGETHSNNTTALYGSFDYDVTIWGSHIHSEISTLSDAVSVTGILDNGSTGAEMTVVGTTVHAKHGATTMASTGRVVDWTKISSSATKTNFLNCELLYETSTSLSTTGQSTEIGGIHHNVAGLSTSTEVNLFGTTIRDGGGTGGNFRGDIVSHPAGASGNQPKISISGGKVSSYVNANPAKTPRAEAAASVDTLDTQRGTATFSSSAEVTVDFPIDLPAVATPNYRVAVSADAEETIWVTDKTNGQFKIRSSNANSTAHVDWILMR